MFEWLKRLFKEEKKEYNPFKPPRELENNKEQEASFNEDLKDLEKKIQDIKNKTETWNGLFLKSYEKVVDSKKERANFKWYVSEGRNEEKFWNELSKNLKKIRESEERGGKVKKKLRLLLDKSPLNGSWNAFDLRMRYYQEGNIDDLRDKLRVRKKLEEEKRCLEVLLILGEEINELIGGRLCTKASELRGKIQV